MIVGSFTPLECFTYAHPTLFQWTLSPSKTWIKCSSLKDNLLKASSSLQGLGQTLSGSLMVWSPINKYPRPKSACFPLCNSHKKSLLYSPPIVHCAFPRETVWCRHLLPLYPFPLCESHTDHQTLVNSRRTQRSGCARYLDPSLSLISV